MDSYCPDFSLVNTLIGAFVALIGGIGVFGWDLYNKSQEVTQKEKESEKVFKEYSKQYLEMFKPYETYFFDNSLTESMSNQICFYVFDLFQKDIFLTQWYQDKEKLACYRSHETRLNGILKLVNDRRTSYAKANEEAIAFYKIIKGDIDV